MLTKNDLIDYISVECNVEREILEKCHPLELARAYIEQHYGSLDRLGQYGELMFGSEVMLAAYDNDLEAFKKDFELYLTHGERIDETW